MEKTIKDILHEDAVNAAILRKNDPKLKEIKNRICKSMGYESFNELLKDNCLNNSAFVANTLEQLMDQIIFEYHDKASSHDGKIKIGKIRAEENSQPSGPIVLQLEIDTSSIENFLKGVSFGIKLKK